MRMIVIILILLYCSKNAGAGIDLRNGNYFVSYTDMEFPGSKADITRSYNSRTSTTGLFGYGWGTLIETKLCALPDGTLILKWWGGGLGDYYEPAVIDKGGLYAMVNTIIADLIKTKKLDNDPVAIAEKKSYYLVNNKERAEKYIELQDKKIAPVYILPSQKKLQWLLDVNQVIQWNGKIFSVKSWDDTYEFNDRGQLSRINDRNFSMQLSYHNNKLAQILIDGKHNCRISTDSSGKITKLDYTGNEAGKTAIYRYDSLNNLVYSKDADDNEYWFSYDLYHNMVRIDYMDKSFVQMTYDPATNRIIKFRDKNGSFNTYQYPYFYTGEGRINYDHYATRVQKYDSIGKLFFTQYKEFENRRRDDGSNYLHRMIEQTDTSYHEAIYKPDVGNAYYRKKNNKVAWADYDSKKRPVYLSINDSIYRSSYNVKGLPEYFLQQDSLTGNMIEYRYSYNTNDQLESVTRNGVKFNIIYHSRENITEIIREEDNSSFAIQNSGDSSYILYDNLSDQVVLTKNEWRRLNDSASRLRSLQTLSVSKKEASVLDVSRNKQNEKELVKIATKQAEEIRKAKEASQKEEKKNIIKEETAKAVEILKTPGDIRKQVISTFYKYADILKPQKIEHEWIWERM